jgi:phosphoesterase RecJ-like protein
VLGHLGKSAVVWNRDAAPSVYSPLPGSDRIHVGSEPPAGFPDRFDAVVVLECPSLDRTGLEEHLPALPLLNVDHHLGNQHYGAVNWVDSAAPSAGEMVFRIAQGLHVDLDPETANCLYLTLVTDTGGFRYSNATPGAFDAASALVKSGARPETVAQWLYESQPLGSVRLTGEVIRTLALHADGRIATVHLDPAMFERSGASPGDAEGLTEVPRSIAGVDAIALFKHRDDGSAKISLRSRGAIDVEQIARRHGGGGHKNAAGCVAEGSGPDLEASFVAELTAALSQ